MAMPEFDEYIGVSRRNPRQRRHIGRDTAIIILVIVAIVMLVANVIISVYVRLWLVKPINASAYRPLSAFKI